MIGCFILLAAFAVVATLLATTIGFAAAIERDARRRLDAGTDPELVAAQLAALYVVLMCT